MGWMRTVLLGDFGTRLDLTDAEGEIKKLKGEQRRALFSKNRQVKTLQDELARQKLAIQALTRFLIVKKMVDQDELDEFIKEVDGEDGSYDGMMHVSSHTNRLVFLTKEEAIKKKQVFKVD